MRRYLFIICIAALSACIQFSPLAGKIALPDSDFVIGIPEGYTASNSDGIVHLSKSFLPNNPQPRFQISTSRLGKMPGDTLENRLASSSDAENLVQSMINGFDVYFWYEGGVGDQLVINSAMITDGTYLLTISATSSADYAEEAQHLLDAMVGSIEKVE